MAQPIGSSANLVVDMRMAVLSVAAATAFYQTTGIAAPTADGRCGNKKRPRKIGRVYPEKH